MSNPAFDLIGLGYCSLDYCCLCPRIPIDDKVEAKQTLMQGGGPAATATYAAAKLGARCSFLSAVGTDEQGDEIRKQMEAVGIDTARMIRREGAASPSAFCWTDASNGNRSIAWTRGSVAPVAADEVCEKFIASATLLHLDGHQTTAAIKAATIAKESDVVVAIDAGTVVPGIDELLKLSDIAIMSEKFMQTHLGCTNPEDAVKKLFHAGSKFSAVTLGSKGSYGFDGATIYHQPSFKVDVVDTTGAGDVFHGAFAYQYIKGGGWQECLRFSAAVAALKCTKFGGRTGIPTLAEAKTFLSENQQ